MNQLTVLLSELPLLLLLVLFAIIAVVFVAAEKKRSCGDVDDDSGSEYM